MTLAPDHPQVEITVVDVRGSGPREPGARMIWRPDGSTSGTIGGGNLERQALDEAAKLWADPERASAFLEYPLSSKLGQCCGGLVRLSLLKRRPPREVLICGAGHVSAALAAVLAEGPFRVTVVDAREEWAAPGRFAPSTNVVADDPEAFAREWAAAPGKAERSYLFIMTHDHPLDQALCQLALRFPFLWIGMIGSRTKWLRFRARLEGRGFAPAEIARIHCPIGDPALGRSPREIAVGAAAQLLAHYHGNPTSPLALSPSADAHPPGPRAGLILAGGASSRMGRWKGGLELGGSPLAEAHARALAEAGAEVWKAVYPAPAQAEAEAIIGPGHRVMNPIPEAPMFASLQLGLRELVRERPEIESVAVTPVDAPPLGEGLLSALWDRHEAVGAWVTRPTAADESGAPRHGHPVILGHRLFAPILAADPATARLDFLIRDLPADLKSELEVASAAILRNLNTPEDYARALEEATL